MLGQNINSVGWPKCGEIDIMEMVGGNGKENTVHGNAFWDAGGVTDNSGHYTLSSGTFF
jgi:beta-glucanase (GH16 family)